MKDRPIVFTIAQADNDYVIKLNGKLQIRSSASDLFKKMVNLTERYNESGYAVLFEVD